MKRKAMFVAISVVALFLAVYVGGYTFDSGIDDITAGLKGSPETDSALVAWGMIQAFVLSGVLAVAILFAALYIVGYDSWHKQNDGPATSWKPPWQQN